MKNLYLVLSIVIFQLSSTAQTVTLETFGPQFPNPTCIANAGDDRLFIVDQEGYINILKSNGTSPSTPFLDIEGRVNNQEESFEAGLLGLAFHPDYATQTDKYFYVYYVDLNNDSCVVSRFTADDTDPDLADSGSELILLNLPIVRGYTHFGGSLHFDSNGYLYISAGEDGMSTGDIDELSQDLNSLRGKILRIDVDNPDSGKNYGVPNGNPFKSDGDPNTLGEIWFYGLRNPAKFSFDSSNGDMWIGDVGHNFWEEIDLNIGNVSGKNYGWPCYEGNASFTNVPPVTCNDTYTFPINTYNHNEPSEPTKCAIIGGFRYRGSMYSNLTGLFFFADWCSSEIFTLSNSGGPWVRVNHTALSGNENWTAFGEGNNKELYVIGNSGGQGKVHKIKGETLSIKDVTKEYHFNIIPNPTDNNEITLNFTKEVDVQEINLYNIQGQKIQSDLNNQLSRVILVKLTDLSTGMYIVEAVLSTGEISQNKLIIK